MSDSFSYLIPIPPVAINAYFEVYPVTYAFYEEAKLRQDHAECCQWYAQVADQHRQELAQMQGEWNPLQWFYRGRRA
ncbi:MAG: hypothetical protein HC772_07165 [Leptolyngbyaceae cyanobacterium CRU_2_3]|nr:hypothetical protein [Leptolyngbyaceae cyanobacterium CRU_2_3]